MNFIKQIERLQMLNKLIKEERTGTPDELANRLGISRRNLYDMIETLKCWGVDIRYERKSATFRFEDDDRIEVSFSLNIIKAGETKKIIGGAFHDNPCFLLHRTAIF